VIIGGGAAGLATAIFAAETARTARSNARVLVLESASRIGAKILISGGGRCNVTHHRVRPDDFNGTRPVVRNVLAAFDVDRTVEWFASLGVPLKQEPSGKLFPTSDRARTVVDALVDRCRALGVTLACDRRVTGMHPGPPFTVTTDTEAVTARAVVLATGGRSLPRTGSDGHGWQVARALGHEVTATYPALVPLVLADDFVHRALSGVSQTVELSTFASGRLVDRRTGSMLWTHFGVSGPAAMDASRHWTTARGAGVAVELRCNFFPGLPFEDIERRLIETARARPRLSLLGLLSAVDGSAQADGHAEPTPVRIPERVAAALLRLAALDPGAPAAELSRDERRRLVHAAGELVLPVARERGWNYAEVTAGGVPLAEIDYRTMESRTRPRLYLVGEILDCDGRIGGFNFQWAWATGYLAGRAAARAVVA